MLTPPKYISHVRKDTDGNIVAYQSNEEHSRGVAELAARFASEFGMGDFYFNYAEFDRI